jgi:uncharacterized membrane protein
MLAKIALLASLAGSARAQHAYTLEVLPSPPGTSGFQAQDVGGLGQVVGGAHLPPPSWDGKAVLWSAGASVVLPGPPFGTWSGVHAVGVSSSHVVGSAYEQTSNTYTVVAMRWTGGVPAVLPIPPGAPSAAALAVADDGVVAGSYGSISGGFHACRWSASDIFQALPEPAGATASAAVSIRADGTILGRFADVFGQSGICAWTPAGQLSVLVPLGQSLTAEAMAADGSVYGTAFGTIVQPTELPFRATGGVVTLLPTLTSMPYARILDAESSGRAVGWSMDTSWTTRAALWHGSNVVDLQSLVLGTGNWILREATGIDESGRICCNGLLNGAPAAFLLSPAGAWSYCTAGTTTNGCNANIGLTSGVPSASNSGGPAVITVSNVEGNKSGLIFYGLASQALPWGTGTSFLCVKAPTQRTAAQTTGGASGTCNGTLTNDINASIAASGGSVTGVPAFAGMNVFLQGWFRDPPAPKTTHLSNGLQITLCP